MHTEFWSENLNGRDYWEEVGIVGKIILECILKSYGGKMWMEFIWLKVGTRGGLL